MTVSMSPASAAAEDRQLWRFDRWQAFARVDKPPVKTKDAKDFMIVGNSIPRLDIPDKVTGTFTYMQDFRVPGMLHARVIRPPAIGGELNSVDDFSINSFPGHRQPRAREGTFWPSSPKMNRLGSRPAQQFKATWSELGRPARSGQAYGTMSARPR